MSFRISGIGTAVPSELITQDDAARLAIELAGEAECHAAGDSGPVSQNWSPQTSQHAHHDFNKRTTSDANVFSHRDRSQVIVVPRPVTECAVTKTPHSIWRQRGSRCLERKQYGARTK